VASTQDNDDLAKTLRAVQMATTWHDADVHGDKRQHFLPKTQNMGTTMASRIANKGTTKPYEKPTKININSTL
jgi:hypothetical protein